MYTEKELQAVSQMKKKRWWITLIPMVAALAAAIVIFVYGQVNRSDTLWGWTAALTVFIVFWMLGRIVWLAFVAALPTSLITLLVLNSLWEKGRRNEWIVGALVLSLLATAYFCFARYRPWQIFLLAAPAELIVWLAFRVRRKP